MGMKFISRIKGRIQGYDMLRRVCRARYLGLKRRK